MCDYSLACELPVTPSGLDYTAVVILCVTGILSDGAQYKLPWEEIWLVFLEYVLAVIRKNGL